MQAKLMKTRFGLCSFVAVAFLLIVPSGSSPAIAAEAEAFIVLPNEAPPPWRPAGARSRYHRTAGDSGANWRRARRLSSNDRAEERSPYSPARNGSRVLLRCEWSVQLQTGRTCRERTRRVLYLYSSQYSAYVSKHRNGTRRAAVRRDTRRFRENVCGPARC